MERRRMLRMALQQQEQELEQVRLELVPASRRCRKSRKKGWEALRDMWVAELWDAWRGRRFHEVRRLRCLIAGK
eukprot:2412530-Alexandrium_andersonii.AAC.1